MDEYASLAGEISDWPEKAEMAELLRRAGFQVTVGKYSIRFDEFDHLVFREYGGDISDPCITADSDSLDALLVFSGRVSQALSANSIRHRFEIYDRNENLAGYFHHNWPPESGG